MVLKKEEQYASGKEDQLYKQSSNYSSKVCLDQSLK